MSCYVTLGEHVNEVPETIISVILTVVRGQYLYHSPIQTIDWG